jgi:hypothetical protein
MRVGTLRDRDDVLFGEAQSCAAQPLACHAEDEGVEQVEVDGVNPKEREADSARHQRIEREREAARDELAADEEEDAANGLPAAGGGSRGRRSGTHRLARERLASVEQTRFRQTATRASGAMADKIPKTLQINEDGDAAVEQWKIKKLIKNLEDARGNGTSMISLIIPPKDQIARVQKMLAGERHGAA